MAKGTRGAPAVRPGKAFHDPQLSIRPTDRLQLAGTGTRHAEVSPRRFDLRRSLLSQFDQARRWLDQAERVHTYTGQQQLAYSLRATGALHEALDYTREPVAVRDRYGMSLFGQSCLDGRSN